MAKFLFGVGCGIVAILILYFSGANAETLITCKNPTTREDGTPLPSSEIASHTYFLNGNAVATTLGVPCEYRHQPKAGTCVGPEDKWAATVTDTKGIVSRMSATSSATESDCGTEVLPLAPTGLKMVVAEGVTSTMTISWAAVTKNNDGTPVTISYYELWLNGKLLTTVKGLSSKRTVKTGTCSETSAFYEVKAVSTAGKKSPLSSKVSPPRAICSPSANCAPQ